MPGPVAPKGENNIRKKKGGLNGVGDDGTHQPHRRELNTRNPEKEETESPGGFITEGHHPKRKRSAHHQKKSNVIVGKKGSALTESSAFDRKTETTN